ncbi:hypothetical protein SAMN05518865_101362 [Duganella sp. CF458]|nr:hypothetical protein SAMN05518865_101362 [Duganella sp. CF458]
MSRNRDEKKISNASFGRPGLAPKREPGRFTFYTAFT